MKPFLLLVIILMSVTPALAESESRNAGIVAEIRRLSGQLDQLRNQNKEIVEQDARIFEELNQLKVQLRRKPG